MLGVKKRAGLLPLHSHGTHCRCFLAHRETESAHFRFATCTAKELGIAGLPAAITIPNGGLITDGAMGNDRRTSSSIDWDTQTLVKDVALALETFSFHRFVLSVGYDSAIELIDVQKSFF